MEVHQAGCNHTNSGSDPMSNGGSHCRGLTEELAIQTIGYEGDNSQIHDTYSISFPSILRKLSLETGGFGTCYTCTKSWVNHKKK